MSVRYSYTPLAMVHSSRAQQTDAIVSEVHVSTNLFESPRCIILYQLATRL